MRAMILAAGRGERMGELTSHTPKPLLKVAGQYLIAHAIQQLVQANIRDIVINVSYLGAQIQAALGDGSAYGVHIQYSIEEERLETGGGIVKALPLLGDEPFIVLSADVISHYPLINLPAQPTGLAHLVMVPNPPYHAKGDFALHDGVLQLDGVNKLTFGNISVLRKELFAGCAPEKFPLSKVLKPAIANQQITGELYDGFWQNIGTPGDLQNISEVI
jgi:MurNAc alpha-1-phosphate uridylyltransferase